MRSCTAGVNHRHGRLDPNPNSYSAHMFLHWVDSSGPYADHAFDRHQYRGGAARGRQRLGRRKPVLGLDLQAIAFDVDDPDALADGGGAAARRPFAVADPHPAAMRVDRLDDDHHLAEQPPDAVVEQRDRLL